MRTKILLFDIENSPSLGWVWGIWEQNVIKVDKEWHMLSFSYKWFGEKKVYSYSLPDFPGYKKDKFNDKALVTKLWELMNEADIVVGHNSDNFDIRKANARFVVHGLTPPEPFKTVDTKKVAKKHFFFNSNKLDDLGTYFGLGNKKETGGFQLWLDCMKGDPAAWKKMVNYNKQDVLLLEKVYIRLLPWITNHPNVNIIDDKEFACPNCGGQKLHKRGFGFTVTSKYPRYHCQSCGHWSRGKNMTKPILIR